MGAAGLWVGKGDWIAIPVAVAQQVEEDTIARLTLNVPDHDRPLVAEVVLGRLPPRSELVLETIDGKILAAISYFGFGPKTVDGKPQVALQRDGLRHGDAIEIIGRVIGPDGERSATTEELLEIRLLEN